MSLPNDLPTETDIIRVYCREPYVTGPYCTLHLQSCQLEWLSWIRIRTVMGTVIKGSELCNKLVYTGDYLTYTHNSMVSQYWPHVCTFINSILIDVLKYYHSFSHPYTNTHSPNDHTQYNSNSIPSLSFPGIRKVERDFQDSCARRCCLEGGRSGGSTRVHIINIF